MLVLIVDSEPDLVGELELPGRLFPAAAGAGWFAAVAAAVVAVAAAAAATLMLAPVP